MPNGGQLSQNQASEKCPFRFFFPSVPYTPKSSGSKGGPPGARPGPRDQQLWKHGLQPVLMRPPSTHQPASVCLPWRGAKPPFGAGPSLFSSFHWLAGAGPSLFSSFHWLAGAGPSLFSSFHWLAGAGPNFFSSFHWLAGVGAVSLAAFTDWQVELPRA